MEDKYNISKNSKGDWILTNRSGDKIKLYGKKELRVPVSVRLPLSVYDRIEKLQEQLGPIKPRPESSMSELYIQILDAVGKMIQSDDPKVLQFLANQSDDFNVLITKRDAYKAEYDRTQAKAKEVEAVMEGKSLEVDNASHEAQRMAERALEMRAEAMKEEIRAELLAELRGGVEAAPEKSEKPSLVKLESYAIEKIDPKGKKRGHKQIKVRKASASAADAIRSWIKVQLDEGKITKATANEMADDYVKLIQEAALSANLSESFAEEEDGPDPTAIAKHRAAAKAAEQEA